MNRKLKNSIMSLFLVAVILISSAFAYLTDTEEKINTFTMGEVDIELTEPNYDPSNSTDLWAGKVMPKDPTVKNVGINDAYVYMMVEVPKASSLKIVGDDNTSSLKENYPLFNFTANDGWTLIKSQVASDAAPYEDEAYDYYLYAYDTKLAKDESATLFNNVTFANITSDFARALAEQENPELDVTVTAYAIQSDLANAADAATAWNLYANQNKWGWPTRPYAGTLADLESKHEFEYYSKFSLAVNDVNNNEIGVNADVDRPDAVAGIYTEDGEAPTVVLFKDAEETATVNLKADMNINLAGNTLNFTNVNKGLLSDNGGRTIVIDGRIDGSEISAVGTGSTGARCIEIMGMDSLNIEDAKLTANTDAGAAVGLFDRGDTMINNIDVQTSSNSGMSVAIATAGENAAITINDSVLNSQSQTGTVSTGLLQQGNAIVSNCKMMCISKGNTVNTIQVGNGTTIAIATISNCDVYSNSAQESNGITIATKSTAYIDNSLVYSDSPYKVSDNSKNSVGIGINPEATGIITNCNIKGTHSGIANRGTLYIDGGTYQGWGHGGIYFGNSGKNAYVKNANVGQWDYDGEYDTSAMSVNNGAAMYIGGYAGADNINVYMNNCKLTALRQCIVLRDTDGEKNNTLYISNSTINTHDIRIDNTTHKLYIGKGCNFDVNSVASNKSAVTQTNEVYTFDMPN